MRNFEPLDAESLLSIECPEALFTNSPDVLKQQFRALAKRWHPDIAGSSLAPKVFAHIVDLHRLAQLKISAGTWVDPRTRSIKSEPSVRTFELACGIRQDFEYLAERQFELGSMFIGQHKLLFEVGHEFSDLVSFACGRINGLGYKNLDMAAEMSKFLPQIEDVQDTAKSTLISIRKTPDQILLSDLISIYKTRGFPLEHAGWMITCLLNLACYLEYSKLTHNAISANTIFVSPLRQTVHLLGGWWYSTPVGQRLVALPNDSIRLIPADIIRSKTADCRADFTLIKALLQDLLDSSKSRTTADGEVCSAPPAMLDFLKRPSRGRAVDDYKDWKYNVLPASFDVPRFNRWDLNSADIY